MVEISYGLTAGGGVAAWLAYGQRSLALANAAVNAIQVAIIALCILPGCQPRSGQRFQSSNDETGFQCADQNLM